MDGRVVHISGTRASIFISFFFVVITGFNDNSNMLLVVNLVVVFVVNILCREIFVRQQSLALSMSGSIYVFSYFLCH